MNDLASFLDKKKAKAAKKKGVRVDEMAKELESSVKIGPAEPEDPTPIIHKVNSEVNVAEKDEEDSEWIQFDSKPKAPLEGVGVFSYADAPEDEQTEEQRKADAAEKPTWKKSEEPEDKKEEIIIPAVSTTQKFEQKPRAYQAPGSRHHGAGGLMHRNKVDIKSEEMFPSIGDADRIMKEEKLRADEYRKVQVEDQAKVATNSRDRFTNDVRQTSTYAPPPQRTSEPPAEPKSYKGAMRSLIANTTGVSAETAVSVDSAASPPPVPKPTPVAPRIVVNPETGRKQRGTGMFNARGDEIMEDLPEERPAPVASATAPAPWRRSEAVANPPTVAAPTLPTGTPTTAAAQPHPPPPQQRVIPQSGTGAGVLNAKGEPIVLREENNPPQPVQNWRSGPRTEQPPAQPVAPQQQQQPQQQQMWRRSERSEPSGPPPSRPQQYGQQRDHYQQRDQHRDQYQRQQPEQQNQPGVSDAEVGDGWQTQNRQRQRPTKPAPQQWRRQ